MIWATDLLTGDRADCPEHQPIRNIWGVPLVGMVQSDRELARQASSDEMELPSGHHHLSKNLEAHERPEDHVGHDDIIENLQIVSANADTRRPREAGTQL